MFWELLETSYMLLPFFKFIKFWSSEKDTENMISDLYFNEESDYSEENTSDNEDFCSSIQPFQFDFVQKKTCGNESHERETTETKDVHASAADLLHIRKGNLDWNENHE